MNVDSRTTITYYGKALVSASFVIAMFNTTFISLFNNINSNDDFSYCFLIPPIIAYLVWEKRSELRDAVASPSWAGVAVIFFGVLLFWLGELSGEYYTLYLSLWFVVAGCVFSLWGWEKFRIILFPVMLSLSMFPLPSLVNSKLSFQLKLISSQLGVDIMQAIGMTAYREGNIIDLGFTQLQVVDACSGLRYLIPLGVLGLLVAYFFKAALWKRILLVISTVPIAIFVNGMRVASVGILYQYFGSAVAEGFFHDFSGWLIFMVSLMILLGEMMILKKIGSSRIRVEGSRAMDQSTWGRRERVEDEKMGIASGTENPESGMKHPGTGIDHDVSPGQYPEQAGFRHGHPRKWRGWLSPPQFLFGIALLGATLILYQGIDFRQKNPTNSPFAELPMTIGNWRGQSQELEKIFIDKLDFSDYAIVDFQHSNGRYINFYVAFYETQQKGASIHSPETCLPGSGWIFRQAGSATIPVASQGRPLMHVKRAIMQKGEFRQLVYFWFPMRGRVLTNAFQMKIFNMVI